MSLINKLMKNSTIKTTAVLNESIFFEKKDMIQTDIPMLNVALSGQVDGGLTPGLLMVAGPSKHFKSGFSLLLASAYLKKYSDGVILFYDSEFGTPQNYFKKFNIDPERVIHTPITDVEQLKHDIIKQLDAIERGDKVIIILDSLGNLASKKEVDDAMDGKSVADMSRAKQNKSLFRMITPYLTLKDIPMIVINHTYKEIGLYPKDIVGGGCVLPETLVKMHDGQLKPIISILPGEFVDTLNGPKEVLHAWDHNTLDEGTPECYEITFDDGSTVTCSDVHKFLDDSGEWIEAQNLVVGQMLATK